MVVLGCLAMEETRSFKVLLLPVMVVAVSQKSDALDLEQVISISVLPYESRWDSPRSRMVAASQAISLSLRDSMAAIHTSGLNQCSTRHRHRRKDQI